jgi:N-methylhydantoinase A/oxoprolinase/acetone carboxylase beta subunit
MDVSGADPTIVDRLFEEMESEGRDALRAAGLAEDAIKLQRTIDVRLLHQRHEITVRISTGRSGSQAVEEAETRFRDEYFTLFGMKPTDPCQLLNFRVRASGSPEKPVISHHVLRDGSAHEAQTGTRRAFFEEFGDFVDTPIYDRVRLLAGDLFAGPAIVEEIDATTICPPGCAVTVDSYLNMRITPAS